MMDKIARDYVALSDMFKDASPEKIDKLKAGMRQMMNTGPYMYLKYVELQSLFGLIDHNMDPEAIVKGHTIYTGERISRPPKPPVEPRKSHFRG